jgi:sugar-specific transcriptional regulator TrmB
MNPSELLKLLPALHEIGLNTNEATVYITLLRIGTNPVSIVAKESHVSRCGCYPVLERLMQKGFIRQFTKNNVSYYTAAEPKHILRQLKNRQSELEDKINGLSKSISQIELIKSSYHGKPRVTFYEGETAVQNIMEDTLNSKTVLRAYASLKELTALFPSYWPNYYKRRTAKGIFVKTIYPADEISFLHKQRDSEELRESRLIPKEFDFHMDILIYDNKVAITSLREKFGVLIESEDMAESQRRIFDIIWDAAAKHDETMTKKMKEIFRLREKGQKSPQQQKNT